MWMAFDLELVLLLLSLDKCLVRISELFPVRNDILPNLQATKFDRCILAEYSYSSKL